MERRVPSLSSYAWLFELETPDGPAIVVMRTDLEEARDALASYLVELGQADAGLASRLAADVPFMRASVVW